MIEFMWRGLAGYGCGIHGRAACEARASREGGGRSFNIGRNFGDDGSAGGVESFPLHSKVHNPRRRNDGRKFHDGHRSHHEKTQRWYQNSIQPRNLSLLNYYYCCFFTITKLKNTKYFTFYYKFE